MESSKYSLRHLMIILAGMLSASIAGIVFNCAGIFLLPIATSLSIDISQVSIFLTVEAIVMTISVSFWGNLFESKPVRLLGAISVIVLAISFFTLSVASNIAIFYFVGVAFGIIMPFYTYLFIPTMINRWFSKRAGTFIGLCFAFDSVSAVIFNPIGASIIDAAGWQMAYRVFGIVVLIMGVIIVLVVRDKPQDIGLMPYGYRQTDSKENENVAVENESGIPASRAWKMNSFWLAAACIVLFGLVLCIYQFLPSYIDSLSFYGRTAMVGATLASVVMAGSMIAKVGLGWISDRSVIVGVLIAAITGFIGLIGLMLIPSNEILVYVFGLLFGVFFAGAAVLPPIIVRTIFGEMDFAKIYSRITAFRAFGSALGVTLWGVCVSLTGFNGLFIIGSVGTILALILGLSSLKSGSIQKSKEEANDNI